MRSKPNWSGAESKAYDFLHRFEIDSYPIDILEVFESFDDVRVTTFTDLALKSNTSVQEIIDTYKTVDGFISYNGKKNKYIVAYNDTHDVKKRMYWTLAHELGHYALGHHKESDSSNIARNSITEEENNVHEAEANFFATYFITTPSVAIESYLSSKCKMASYFAVTRAAAAATLRHIKKREQQRFLPRIPDRLRPNLERFIKKVRTGRVCSHCDIQIWDPIVRFCPNCASTNFRKTHKGFDVEMIYPGIETDANNRAITCPKCKNSCVERGRYCPICGTELINGCTNSYCNSDLPGYARYCTECGCTSRFLAESLLKPWDEEPTRSIPTPEEDFGISDLM